MVLQNVGINLAALSVVAGAVGLGVGFGLQNVVSNFISGLIITMERPIKVGDRIEVGGVEGVVQEIGARCTTVITNDRMAILVPNQRFILDIGLHGHAIDRGEIAWVKARASEQRLDPGADFGFIDVVAQPHALEQLAFAEADRERREHGIGAARVVPQRGLEAGVIEIEVGGGRDWPTCERIDDWLRRTGHRLAGREALVQATKQGSNCDLGRAHRFVQIDLAIHVEPREEKTLDGGQALGTIDRERRRACAFG